MAQYIWQKRDAVTGDITDVELLEIQKDLQSLGYPFSDNGSYHSYDEPNIWRAFDHPHWVRVTIEYCYRKHLVRGE